MHWHKEGLKKLHGKIRHPADAKQWGNINSHFGWFDRDPRNVRFAVSIDGVNPFGNYRSTHSTWPVVLPVYNLPPWLCNKWKYIMLTILVFRPRQPSDRIDVNLRPLVDDFKTLWKHGVAEVWDEFTREEFTLHAMLFTTINNNPAQCNLSSKSKRKGAACPHCLEGTCIVWLRNSKTFSFMGHRHFLPKKRAYRGMDCQFDGEKENGVAPLHVTGDLVHLQVKDIKTIEELSKLTKKILGKRKKRDGDEEEVGKGI